MVALDDFTPLQGGIPIEVDGQVIGGVGVSGAASAQQDEELAIAGASAVKSPAAKEAAGVSYFDREKVNAAFAKGSVLFNQSDQFEVHTSRRDAAGLAELHATDSDIFYILSGRATLVTGGTLVAPQQVAANEVRGREISGGETRQIVKGDVIIIPAGTPHWFKEVPEPITYYTVKSR
jgi:glc operon protein GlcG